MTRRSMVAIAMLVAVVACGDSKSATSPTTTAARATTTASAAATTIGTATTQSADPVTAEITAAFVTFFNGKDANIDKKVSLLENGEKYRTMLVDASKDPKAQGLTANIRSVKMLSATECTAISATSPCAVVNLDLLVSGFPALAAHDSTAVKVGSVWKVSAKAWCEFVAIGGSTCPA